MTAKQESEPLLGGEDEQKEHLYPDIIRDAVTTDAGKTNSISIVLFNSWWTPNCVKFGGLLVIVDKKSAFLHISEWKAMAWLFSQYLVDWLIELSYLRRPDSFDDNFPSHNNTLL